MAETVESIQWVEWEYEPVTSVNTSHIMQEWYVGLATWTEVTDTLSIDELITLFTELTGKPMPMNLDLDKFWDIVQDSKKA